MKKSMPTGRAMRTGLDRSRVILAGLIVSAGVVFFSLLGCGNHYGEDGKSSDSSVSTTDVQSFGGVGSTFVEPLITRWMRDYGTAHKVQINYRPIGSGAGINEFKQGHTTFAASDAPLDDDQLRGMPSLLQIPVTAGPVSITYNLPGLSAPLRFSGKTLAGIFSGDIISWQDPSIAAENPGAKLPHAAIILVHRSDGSGTTSIFTRYLSSVSPAFATKVGHGITVNWPAGLGASASSALLAMVKNNPATIGYVELSFARQAGLPVASIQNRAGEYVVPSPQSASLAVTAFTDALAKDIRTPVVDPPASAKGAYPISGITYVMIPRDDNVVGVRQAFKNFMAYAITTGQDSAEELSYVRLPGPIQQQSQNLLNQMMDHGHSLR